MNDKDETSRQATRIAWVWIENDEGLYNAVNEQAHAEGQTVNALADSLFETDPAK